MSRTNTTILPPPSDYPVPMPDMAPSEPDTSAWKAVLAVTHETARPGILGELWAGLEAEIAALEGALT